MSQPTPHYLSIAELLNKDSFSIDEYQREYKWEQKPVGMVLQECLP